jgi:hypothetical protein
MSEDKDVYAQPEEWPDERFVEKFAAAVSNVVLNDLRIVQFAQVTALYFVARGLTNVEAAYKTLGLLGQGLRMSADEGDKVREETRKAWSN